MSDEESYDSAVLVTAGWGDDVLWAEEVALGSPLTLPESFVDHPWTLVASRPGRETVCVVPAHVALDETHSAAAENRAPSALVPGAMEIALRKRTRLRLQLADQRWITVGMVRSSRRVAQVTAGGFVAGLADRWTALSLFAHVALLALSAFCVWLAPAPPAPRTPSDYKSLSIAAPEPAPVYSTIPLRSPRKVAALVRLDMPRLDSPGLPAEVVRRIVRMNLGRQRACYERALAMNPTLEGTVVTNVVIARDGGVALASDGGSALPNVDACQCIFRSFLGLSFPQPEGPPVRVQLVLRLRPVPWDGAVEQARDPFAHVENVGPR